ncbi:MAG: hypothetical protein QF570_04865 [Myxococcota bacterium]|jgi:hypothetical protein|nr:hypothetical protein [Myxococcota bacterium]
MRTALPSLLLLNFLFATVAYGDDSQGDPRLDYMLQCQGCHGADGGERPSAGVPTLVDLVPRFLGSDEGREFVLRVPGVSQAPLSNEALASLMNWLLETYRSSEAAPQFTRYRASEVARARELGPFDVTATRARLLADER